MRPRRRTYRRNATAVFPFLHNIATPQSGRKEYTYGIFNSAVGVLQTLVIALGAGLGIWGVINLMEGYGNANPGAKSQGMKQFMAKYL